MQLRALFLHRETTLPILGVFEMSQKSTQVVLKKRPTDNHIEACFKFESKQLQDLENGEIRVANHFISIDPYIRLRLNNAKSYMPPQALNSVIESASAGVIVASRHSEFNLGDEVVGQGNWQSFYQGKPDGFRRVNTQNIPLTAYLGPLGMTGITAWVGVMKIIKPLTGEQIIVNAASGAVGSVAGQICKSLGARVIGVAGGKEKCCYVTNTLGFDACLDYKAAGFEKSLDDALAGNGIDGLFENVGGKQLDLFMERMNPHARVALCGLISGSYDSNPLPIANANHFLTSRFSMKGFIVSDYLSDWPEALRDIAKIIANGGIVWRETIDEGLANAPNAFINMLNGKNIGKQLIKIK